MPEKPSRLTKFILAASGISIPALAGAVLLIEQLKTQATPTSLEVAFRVGASLTFYREGIVMSSRIRCESIPISENRGFLSGGFAIQKSVLMELNPSIKAFGETDYSDCYRPWVLDRQRAQSVQ